MAASPVYAVTPRLAMAQVSTANTNRDGTGTIATLIAGAATGTRVERVVIEATGNTTAGVVRLFLYDGTNTRLFSETLVSALTASTTVAAFRKEITLSDVVLPSTSHEIRASTNNAETFNIFAFGADL